LFVVQNHIPLLSQDCLESNLQAGSLVRVRGQVQDMMEEEYYPTTVQTTARQGMHSRIGTTDLAERTPLVVVPVPFVTPWFRDVFYERAPPEHRPKRARLDENENQNSSINSSNNQMDCDGDGEHENTNENTEWWPADRMKSDPQQVPVFAKLYYDLYGPQPQEVRPTRLRLNEVVELIGILEHEDTTKTSGSNAPGDFDVVMGAEWEDEGAAAVPSHIPRLHVVWYSHVDMDLDSTPSLPKPIMSENRVAPVQALSQALSIPETPAAAIWMTMLSMAEREKLAESDTWAPVQTPNETTLGCASLGMILPSHEACAAFSGVLYSVLSQVAPVVHFLDMTNDSLKEMRAPCKIQGRLAPTPLQLPKGSTLIINVSSVQPGRLSSEVVVTFQALRHLSQGHNLPYRFDGGIKIPFEADLRVIVLSTHASNKLLACTLQVQCDYNQAPDPAQSPSVATLPAVRDVLTLIRGKGQTLSPAPNIALSAAVLDKAQQDFIQRRATARNTNRPAVTERDFHRWLTLTRLQARSRQARMAEVEDWSLALTLDDAMVASLQLI
jgi:hypothetical protein